ncbi:MAG: methyltransferase domain-containing protein [Phycisphaera sp.]|nr:methyltransferase domain-containing protein [Phycisphaera sp.]
MTSGLTAGVSSWTPTALGYRARLLRSLERFFPRVADAPCASGEHAAYEFAKAAGSYADFVRELGGLAGKRVLDFGCGWGGETAWLAQQSLEACGCDIDPRSLEDAERFKSHQGITNLRFGLVEGYTIPFGSDTFDAVLSTNVFEHVMDPTSALREIKRVLKPGGVFRSRFGPLFYSPLGYHLPWATQVPWAHLLFGFDAVMQVRNVYREPIVPPPKSWEETGLNRVTFARFKGCVIEAGLEIDKLERTPVRGLRALAYLPGVPGVGDLFTFGIDCRLVKP